MPNCTSFQRLTIKEKTEFIGELIHIVQNDESCFHVAETLIELGRKKGIMDDVKVGPDAIEKHVDYGINA